MAHGHAKKFVPLWTQIVVNNLKIKDLMLVIFLSNCRCIKYEYLNIQCQIINPLGTGHKVNGTWN